MRQQLRHRRLPPPRPREIARCRRERTREPVAPRLCPRTAQILIERCRAEDVQILIGRTLRLAVLRPRHRLAFPRSRKPRQIPRHDREIRLHEPPSPLQTRVPRHEHGKEDGEEQPEQHLSRRPAIISVDQRRRCRREHKRTCEHEPPMLPAQGCREHECIFPCVFIKIFLQKDASPSNLFITMVTYIINHPHQKRQCGRRIII